MSHFHSPVVRRMRQQFDAASFWTLPGRRTPLGAPPPPMAGWLVAALLARELLAAFAGVPFAFATASEEKKCPPTHTHTIADLGGRCFFYWVWKGGGSGTGVSCRLAIVLASVNI